MTAPTTEIQMLNQLQMSIDTLSLGLSPEALAGFDEICPRPGGEAPKAYA